MTAQPSAEERETLIRKAFDDYYRKLCFYCRRYLPDEQDVQDVVMDTFLALSRSTNTFANDLALSSFLYTSVYNGAMNRLRGLSRRENRHKRLQAQLPQWHEDEYVLDRIDDDLMWKLLSAIEELPPECSRIFKMSYLDGKNIREVALELQISEHTVKAQRARGKKLLQQKLGNLYPLLALFFLS